MKRITKLFQTVAKSIDEDSKTIRFKISDNKPDRMDEVVDQETWDFKNYLNNPILLWGHNPDEPENVLGSTLSLDTENGETYATVRLDEDINPKAGLVWRQLLRGTLRTVSVGFINHTFATDKDQPVLKDNELLEISIVPIPANPRAIALSYKDGSISRKDAKWLMDSMRKETELIESQMETMDQYKEKNMSDEQAKALIDVVSGLTKGFEEFKTATETRFTALDEQVKAVAEAKPEAPAKQPVPAPDAKTDPEAPAKPGDDDQGGAGKTDEFDPEAELTPEIQAEIDAAIASEQQAA